MPKVLGKGLAGCAIDFRWGQKNTLSSTILEADGLAAFPASFLGGMMGSQALAGD